jgi:FkbM family methyltransferase
MSLASSVRNRLFPSEFSRLIREASSFPRYSRREISFRGMRIAVPDYLSVAWQLDEIFREERLRFEGPADSVIYDVGANAGVATLYFKKMYPSSVITAVEADPSIFSFLENNMQANGLDDVRLICAAAWTSNGKISFRPEGADAGSIDRDAGDFTVESVRLRDLLGKETRIDMLKMDIEGAETDVLLDCRDQLSKVSNLYVEYHSFSGVRQRLDELLSALARAGFRYSLRTGGKPPQSPFMQARRITGMDIQLDIHAYRE